MGPISKEECVGLGKGPEEVHKNDPWNEELVVWGMVEDSGSVLVGVWKDEGGDLIETYRILRGLDRVAVEGMFPLVGKTGTRGHNLSLKG